MGLSLQAYLSQSVQCGFVANSAAERVGRVRAAATFPQDVRRLVYQSGLRIPGIDGKSPTTSAPAPPTVVRGASPGKQTSARYSGTRSLSN